MTPSFDAIAIGGGLAGCAFAITMARAGRKVAVIERTRVALPKVCGDFLSAEALVLLQRLGIDPDRLFRVREFPVINLARRPLRTEPDPSPAPGTIRDNRSFRGRGLEGEPSKS